MFLITGATGFVGTGLRETLRQRDIPFRATGRRAGDQLFAVGEIDGKTEWSDALDGIEVVVHLASVNQNVVEGSPEVLDAYRTVNVDGTLNLARQAAAAGVKRFVFVSSIKVNGEATSPGRPFAAKDTPDPQTDYGATKLEAELQLHVLSGDSGMEIVVIRPPLVYGPGMRGSFDALVRLVRRGIPLPFGSVRNRRSMVYLENLTDLIVTAATHPDAAGGTFIVGDAHSPSTPELLRLIADAIGSPMRLLPFPPVLLEAAARLLGKQDLVYRLTRSLEVDTSEAEARLGWTPPFAMREGLSRTLGAKRRTKI